MENWDSAYNLEKELKENLMYFLISFHDAHNFSEYLLIVGVENSMAGNVLHVYTNWSCYRLCLWRMCKFLDLSNYLPIFVTYMDLYFLNVLKENLEFPICLSRCWSLLMGLIYIILDMGTITSRVWNEDRKFISFSS